jgi:hypothetical protein
MRIRNHSNERLQRKNEAGGWTVILPGQTFELPHAQGEYLLKVEPHFWEQADLPIPEPLPKTKTMKKGGA